MKNYSDSYNNFQLHVQCVGVVQMLKCSYIAIGYWPTSTLDSNSLIIKNHKKVSHCLATQQCPDESVTVSLQLLPQSVSLARLYLREWYFHLANWQQSYIALTLPIASYHEPRQWFIVVHNRDRPEIQGKTLIERTQTMS